MTGHGSQAIAHYTDLICEEIAVTPTGDRPLDTIFFGGGTPSLLTVRQLGQILGAIDRQFSIASTAEISIEMDPGTFTQSQIQGYVDLGINRVSLGVQAFQAELLQLCGRTHTPDDIDHAVEMLHQAGVKNYSLDLISGLPKQTIEHWRESLERAIALHPTHISVYDLTIEAGTAFDRWYQPGSAPLPSDTTTADMYRLAQRRLTQAGYNHYEISNYAKVGYACRHNQVYWENRPYYGIGMGATSYVVGQRVSRPRTRKDYERWVSELVAHGGKFDWPPVTEQEAMLDTLMLGLRLADGIDLDRLHERFGDRPLTIIVNCLQSYAEKHWVEFLRTPHNLGAVPSSSHLGRVRLSDPEGFLFSNIILSDLFSALEEG